ncbi:MAG: DNA-binding protein WhiA [Clostridia bacterium]|nr:DNA-binding protein WhiA [Clostridia bacterium]
MSFSGDFRHSLLEGRAKGKCCRAAFVSGYLTGAGTLCDGAVRMNYVDPEAAAVLSEYLPAFDRAATLTAEGERRVKIMTVTGRAAVDLASDPAPAFPEFRCNLCKANYLAGLFASCGRVSDPAREWRLEFSCGDHRERLLSVFSRLGFDAKTTDRRDERLLYLRSSSAILDFFALTGESDFYFGLMNGSIKREIRNSANRLANCEANNIAKAISASDEQVKAIRYLEKHKLTGGLDPTLIACARLRLENPDKTLSQLAAIAVPPVSRAGLNHRLHRLCEIAEQHREKNEGQAKKGKEAAK